MPVLVAGHHQRSLNAGLEMPLIQRDQEITRLMQCVREGKHALLCGPPGIGKTRLLLEIRSKLEAQGATPLFLRFTQPLHRFLLAMAANLSLESNRTSSIALRGLLWKQLEAKPRVILLDHIAEAGMPFYRFFERVLFNRGTTLIGALYHPYSTGSLYRVFWNQQTIFTLRPLNKQGASALTEEAVKAFVPELSGMPSFKEQVMQAARGNPGRIVEMCRWASNPVYRDGNRIRFAALSIDSLTGFLS